MGASVYVGEESYSIGSYSFSNAFFSTISVYCEPNGWGASMPLLMKKLYFGDVSFMESKAVINELLRARAVLERHPPSDVVWNFEDRSIPSPFGDNLSSDITSLGNYFVTSHGQDLFETLINAFVKSYLKREDVCLS